MFEDPSRLLFTNRALPLHGNEVDTDEFQETAAHAWRMLASGLSPRAASFFASQRVRSGRTFAHAKRSDPLGNPTRQRPASIANIDACQHLCASASDPAIIVQHRHDFAVALSRMRPVETLVLRQLLAGQTFKAIGIDLGITARRVSRMAKGHIASILVRTLGSDNLSLAIRGACHDFDYRNAFGKEIA